MYVFSPISIRKRNVVFVEKIYIEICYTFMLAHCMYLLTNIKYTTVGLCMYTMSI